MGTVDADGPSAGSGGGGGYGDGGGGAASGHDNDDAVGSGGAGGSNVRPSATGGTPVYDVASTGASEDPGDDGRIAFTLIGPAVVTEASAATGVTGTTATTHSTVDPNSDMPVTEVTIEYTTDPDFATGITSVPGTPDTLPGVVGDAPITTALTGLAPGTVYYYRIVAKNAEVTTAGQIAVFQTPIAVTGISPTSGPETGGTTVTITGAGFRSGTTVTVGGVACAPVEVASSTSLTCRTGAHVPATVDVVVGNPGPDPQSATLPGAYTYTPTPVVPGISIAGIRPTHGPETGGTLVTINGGGFTSGMSVRIGGVACTPVTILSSSELTCRTGAHKAGTVDVVVTLSTGETAKLDEAYTYDPEQPDLNVVAKAHGHRLKVGQTTRVVRAVNSTGHHRISAYCSVDGHRLKKACDVKINQRKGHVFVTPACNDRVSIKVRIVARSHGETEVWHRSWQVKRQPRVTCSANANG